MPPLEHRNKKRTSRYWPTASVISVTLGNEVNSDEVMYFAPERGQKSVNRNLDEDRRTGNILLNIKLLSSWQ